MSYYKTWQTKENRSKYRSVKKFYNGSWFQSQKEAAKAAELDMLLKAKQIKSYTKQVKEELFGQNGTKICAYYCDFLIIHLDGSLEYLEIKSKATALPEWKIKWKLLQDKYLEDPRDIRFTVEY